MKDYPIRAVFTDAQGVQLEVVEEKGCDGCHYSNDDTDEQCRVPRVASQCEAYHRSDNTGVIFRPVEPQPVCHFTLRNQVRYPRHDFQRHRGCRDSSSVARMDEHL